MKTILSIVLLFAPLLMAETVQLSYDVVSNPVLLEQYLRNPKITWNTEFGVNDKGVDVKFYAETSGDYSMWDQSLDSLIFVGSNIWMDDDSDIVIGTDLDWKFECDTAKTLEFIPVTTDESSTFNIGADTAGADFKMFGATTGAYWLWDSSADQMVVAGAGQLSLNDSVELLLGTGTSNAGDFKVYGTSTPTLVFDVVAAGTGEMEIGNDADDVPLKWFGETTGDFVYFTGDDLQFEDISLCIAEGTQIQFGDALGTGDVTMSCTSNLLTIGQVVAGTGAVALGVNDAGMDFTLFGDTALQKAWWDASGDQWYYGADAEGVDVTFYGDTTGKYMLWDESADQLVFFGQTAGQILFEGTDNEFETTLTVTDPTADRTVTVPDVSGTVQVASAAVALTPGASVTLTVGQSNVYTDTITTDNQDQTITFSGAGTSGQMITIIFVTDTGAGSGDEVITFHSTLVSSIGTLTLADGDAKVYTITFISDGSKWYEISRTAVHA